VQRGEFLGRIWQSGLDAEVEEPGMDVGGWGVGEHVGVILDFTVKTPNFAHVGAHTQILALPRDPLQNCTNVLNLLDAKLTAYTKASSNKGSRNGED
jgi:hypothetical protein